MCAEKSLVPDCNTFVYRQGKKGKNKNWNEPQNNEKKMANVSDSIYSH